jgi:hypothetical protein
MDILDLGGAAQIWICESFLYGYHEAWTNDQSTSSFYPPQNNEQGQSYCTNIQTLWLEILTFKLWLEIQNLV